MSFENRKKQDLPPLSAERKACRVIVQAGIDIGYEQDQIQQKESSSYDNQIIMLAEAIK